MLPQAKIHTPTTALKWEALLAHARVRRRKIQPISLKPKLAPPPPPDLPGFAPQFRFCYWNFKNLPRELFWELREEGTGRLPNLIGTERYRGHTIAEVTNLVAFQLAHRTPDYFNCGATIITCYAGLLAAQSPESIVTTARLTNGETVALVMVKAISLDNGKTAIFYPAGGSSCLFC